MSSSRVRRLVPAPLRRPLREAVHRVLYSEPARKAATRYLHRWWGAEVERVWTHPDGPPEWYDHRSHLSTFPFDRDPLWAERGVYSRELIAPGAHVLDLCCGDGFYSFHFFSDRAGHVDAIDFDEGAIAHARRTYALPNITHAQVDVRKEPFPAARYDVIVWDGAIEHFTIEEIDELLDRCRSSLEPTGGVLTGYTIRREETVQHPDHEHEFEDADELAATLRRVFPAVAVLENTTAGRRNLYFRAGFDDAALSAFRPMT